MGKYGVTLKKYVKVLMKADVGILRVIKQHVKFNLTGLII